MNRRSALTALGSIGAGTLAGCVGVPRSISSDSSPESDSDNHTVSLDSQYAVPSKYGMEISVEVLEPEFTAEHPAKIQITTTNNGDKRFLSTGADRCYLFNRSQGGSDDPSGLWLHDPNASEYIDRKGDRWVADTPPHEPRGFASYGCMMKQYEGGASVTKEYEIWDDYRVSGYLEPGTYRWEETVRISPEESASSTDSTESFSWWFALQLKHDG